MTTNSLSKEARSVIGLWTKSVTDKALFVRSSVLFRDLFLQVWDLARGIGHKRQ